MTYATQQDLVDRFGEAELIQLTDRADPRTGQIDTAVVARALADADATINSYVKSRYSLPLAAVPQVLVRIAADLARFALYDDHAPDHVAGRQRDAIQYLRGVADGRATLGDDDQLQSVAQKDTVRTDTPGDRILDRDSLDDF